MEIYNAVEEMDDDDEVKQTFNKPISNGPCEETMYSQAGQLFIIQ